MSNLLWYVLAAASLGISGGVGWTCLRRRKVAGALPYAGIAFSQAGWTLAYILERASGGLAAKLLWDNAQLLGACGWWLCFQIFADAYTRRALPRPAARYGLLAAPAIAFLALAYSDPLHGLMRRDVRLAGGEGSGLLYGFTPAFLAGVLFLFAGFCAGFARIALRMARSFPAQRAQLALVLSGNALPLLGVLLTVTAIRDSPYRDISPFTFAAGNLMVVLGLLRYGLFEILPIARERIVEEMEDAVVVADAERRVVFLNPSAAALACGAEGRPLGRAVDELFPDLAGAFGLSASAAAAAEIEDATPRGRRWLESRSRPLRDPDGRLLGNVTVIRDITERKRMELELAGRRTQLEELVAERTRELSAAYERLAQQVGVSEKAEEHLRQVQKMEAVGRLAGGIVHDFNNLLVPILGYAEMARMSAKPGTRLHEDLTQIEVSARRAADLVAQILAFSRKQVLEFQILDLNDEIRKFAKLIGRFLGDGVRLELRLAPPLHAVKADRSQVLQVLMNLCVNARDAMPEGGRLIIETANVPSGDGGSADDGPAYRPDAPWVLLSVRDTGSGMDAETLKHIFEPFYTTKQSGKGTGLGLAVVYGIVERHGGRIRVASRPGAGTEFRLLFPAAAGAADGTPYPEDGLPFQAGSETILVVDPDEGVRRLAHDALAAYGYRVSQAAGPEEACTLAGAAPGPIHLLLTDIALPGQDGPALFPRLRAIHPGLRALYMSGFAEKLAQQERHGAGVLKKPFAIRNLLEAVRLALGSLAHAAS